MSEELDEYLAEDSERIKRRNFYKRVLIKGGILSGIIAGFFGLMVCAILFGNGFRQRKLKIQIEQVLAKEPGNQLSCGKWVNIQSHLQTTAAVYELEEYSKKTGKYAVLLRVPTIYGPVGAVYVYDSARDYSEFSGIAGIGGEALKRITKNSEASQIYYWNCKIPQIIAARIPEKAKKQKGRK